MNKKEMIALLKTEFPTLQTGDDLQGYVELSSEQYEAQIKEWADARLAKLAIQAEAETKAQAKIELLNRLGITEDEAKLLLA